MKIYVNSKPKKKVLKLDKIYNLYYFAFGFGIFAVDKVNLPEG
jgi:hypothetical protein